MPLTAQQVAQKWSRNAQGASQSFVDGVTAVTVAPGQKAAQNREAYLANIVANVDKWAERVASVPLEEWKATTIAKGRARYGPGVAAAEGNFSQFMTEFLPHLATVQAELENMPRGSLDQNIARAIHVMNRNAQFHRSR